MSYAVTECIQVVSGDTEVEVEIEVEVEVQAHYEPGQRGGPETEPIAESIEIEWASRLHDLVIDGQVVASAGSRVMLSEQDCERLAAQIMEGRDEP